MTRAHDMVHIGHCGEVGHCRYVGGPGGEQCDALDSVLAQAEDDRAHADAERIRAEAKEEQGVADSSTALYERGAWSAGAMLFVADMIDPYEKRDGQLVRKADGKPVNL